MKNIVVAFGDFGGRMHNRLKQDQLFVIIPTEFLHYLPKVIGNISVAVKGTRRMTKPSHSDFWEKKQDASAEPPPAEETAQAVFTMKWTEEARALMSTVPEGIMEMAVKNAEEYAQEKGYAEVSKKSIEELMSNLEMDLDDMLG
ncbi:MAG: PCP reductase family protein [Proteobacteria bacterium]|nr:PCP reductase family protein [Pseudomonadota bacterium]